MVVRNSKIKRGDIVFEIENYKSENINIRVTKDEKELLLLYAKSKGYKNISDYIRSLIKGDIEK